MSGRTKPGNNQAQRRRLKREPVLRRMADDLRDTLDPTLRGMRCDDGSPTQELVLLSESEYRLRLRMAGRDDGPLPPGLVARALCDVVDELAKQG